LKSQTRREAQINKPQQAASRPLASMHTNLPHPEPIRDEVQMKARAMGINETFISILVDSFYGRIRSHEVLGPIFNDVIADNWEPHLTKMKTFWGAVTLYTGAYSGRPVPVHKKLEGLQREHFSLWLGLFRETLEAVAPNPEVVELFYGRASGIAQSLQLAIFHSDK
jgi:hemoglobin